MSLYARLCDSFLGPCVHQLRADDRKTLYLTFDDGPVAGCTDLVLNLLGEFGAKATFFVIAERARRERSLVDRMRAEGHALGNHSLDHDYRNFFRPRAQIVEWVKRAEEVLKEIGVSSVGFRSPAGVRTPPLHAALRQLRLPLVHWSIRFYDTRVSWTPERALRSLRGTPSGSIVLLHDSHEGARALSFTETLREYLRAAREEGFSLERLPPIPNPVQVP